MKRIPLILSTICLIAVGLLYVLYFVNKSGDKVSASQDEKNITAALDISSNSIVYINIDTVVSNYDLYFDLKKVFENKYKTSEAELASKEKKLRIISIRSNVAL